jgi:hypothetical protein
MSTVTRRRLVFVSMGVTVAIVCVCWLVWHLRAKASAGAPSTSAVHDAATTRPSSEDDPGSTLVYAHNIRLLKGPNFRVYIRWIRGEMERTHAQVVPSLDEPESFVLLIQKGIIRANIGDIGTYLNASLPSDAPLKNISIQPEGDHLRLHGTAHKVVPLPVELDGSLVPVADGRVRFHVTKINVLKIPMKGLLGGLHIELSDLVPKNNVPGVQVVDNDIFLDTQKLLPPPHIRGKITSLRVNPPDIEVTYGNASVDDDARLAQWHNFLRLNGGTLGFGKLTMHHVDLTLIDASQDPWFGLDLVNYQSQLVNGYTRMTPQAGLEIFMPDVDPEAPAKASQKITLEWLKDRNRSLPLDLPDKK